MATEKTVGRLSLYRRIAQELAAQGQPYVFSHALAQRAGVTAAQVRRDMMAARVCGSPSRGYAIGELIDRIGRFIHAADVEPVALVGVGNLGRSLLAHFLGRSPHLEIAAAFDNDPDKVNRVVQGTRCYPMEELERVIRERGIITAVLTVPASAAQAAADRLARAGIRGLLNFAPVPLRLPADVHVQHIDITVALEKAAFFARKFQPARK